jgi:hypothetical protein
MVVQLALIAIVLKFIFAQTSPVPTPSTPPSIRC